MLLAFSFGARSQQSDKRCSLSPSCREIEGSSEVVQVSAKPTIQTGSNMLQILVPASNESQPC